MKKCKERRTITHALVIYHRLGLCNSFSLPFELFKRIVGVCGKNHSLAKDLWAIYETLFVLKTIEDTETLKAVENIYLKPFAKNILKKDIKNEISYRIIKYARENFMDPRTVYRKLQKAKKIFVKIRSGCE